MFCPPGQDDHTQSKNGFVCKTDTRSFRMKCGKREGRGGPPLYPNRCIFFFSKLRKPLHGTNPAKLSYPHYAPHFRIILKQVTGFRFHLFKSTVSILVPSGVPECRNKRLPGGLNPPGSRRPDWVIRTPRSAETSPAFSSNRTSVIYYFSKLLRAIVYASARGPPPWVTRLQSPDTCLRR